MKSLKTIQTLFKVGKILSRLAFMFALIGFCGCIAGLLSLKFGSGELIRIGDITLHRLLDTGTGQNTQSICAALSGWSIVCAGEGVVAKFAEIFFRNEQAAGTPFTSDCAAEIGRLGVLTIAVPTGCAVVGKIMESIADSFQTGASALGSGLYLDTTGSIALGVAFLVMVVLCRYGAELREGSENRWNTST